MTNLSRKQFDDLVNQPENIREILIEGYDLADGLEQQIALGYFKIRPDYVYNAGRQFPVLAIWK